MFLVDAVQREGYSLSNVESSLLDIKQKEGVNLPHEELAMLRAKQSLLHLLMKAYKYTLK
jgi:hypothetical protein